MPREAYIAPMGMQVFAGLIVRALRSTTSAGVCFKSMISLLDGSRGGWSRLFGLPRRLDQFPDAGVHQAVDLAVEVGRPREAGIRAADVVVVQLLARHAHLLDGELLLDAGAEDGRLVLRDQLLGLVVVDVVDDQRASL